MICLTRAIPPTTKAQPRRLFEDESHLGLCYRQAFARTDEGTPDQRQLSISSRSAAYVSVVESAATPSIVRYPSY